MLSIAERIVRRCRRESRSVAAFMMPVITVTLASGSFFMPSARADDDAGGPVIASVPSTIPFQGFLTDASGIPVNGTVSLRLRIYDSASGGTLLWAETQSPVNVSQGVFQIAMPALAPFPADLFDSAPRFLGIQVNGEPELPRTELRATPFAIRASDADSVDVGINLRQGPVSALRSRQSAGGTDLEWRNADTGLLAAQLGAGVGSGAGASGTGALVLYDVTPSSSILRAGLLAADSGIAPSLYLNGALSDVYMYMGSSEDASVQLPASAISAPEIADEPGVASANNTGLVTLTSSSPTSVISRTITAPNDGFVLALGQCATRINHTNGTFTEGAVGLSDDGVAFGTAQDVNVQVSGNAPTGTYAIPAHVSGVFTVTGGAAKTIHMVATEVTGDIRLEDLSLSLLFVPTSYGTVSPTLMVPESGPEEATASRTPQAPAEIAAERAASERWNQERIERELAVIRAEADAREARMRAETDARIAELERRIARPGEGR